MKNISLNDESGNKKKYYLYIFILGTCICLNFVHFVLIIIAFTHTAIIVKINNFYEKVKEKQFDVITNLYLINKTNSITKEECHSIYPLYEQYHHLFEFIIKFYTQSAIEEGEIIKYKNLANLLLKRKDREYNKNKIVLFNQEEQYCSELQIYLKQNPSSTEDKKFFLQLNDFKYFYVIYPLFLIGFPTILSPIIYFAIVKWTENLIKK